MPKIILFKDTHYQGAHIVLQQAVPNLEDLNWNDTVSSLIVCSGTWSLYDDTDYKGKQYVVNENGGPSGDGLFPSYKDWGQANDKLSSLKPA